MIYENDRKRREKTEMRKAKWLLCGMLLIMLGFGACGTSQEQEKSKSERDNEGQEVTVTDMPEESPTVALEPTVTPESTATSAEAFEYMLNSRGEIKILKLRDSSLWEVIVPSEIDGVPVTEIGSNAFSYCSNLEKVVLQKGIVRIGDHAFSECSSLTSIE